ncbi:MAG: hypothetical protein Faunusvirus12_16 [Faunusvirus sp.]|uniref:Uncharacterized protein n=1 Tax=Faunusvirus sp. TaxID=2487766 RepID=A0A3G5A0N9_9VIRU|nr:MAG: hypothetical protein Faunusvirus12_16 [Faunusvirus sp.]
MKYLFIVYNETSPAVRAHRKAIIACRLWGLPHLINMTNYAYLLWHTAYL